jgi:glycosyltransferase involved in cell wall biosynthesis
MSRVLENLLRVLLPPRLRAAIRAALPARFSHTAREIAAIQAWRSARTERPWSPSSGGLPFGANLIGYLQAVKGIGEASRLTALALAAARIPFSTVDFETGIPASQRIEPVPPAPNGTGFVFPCNLIHMNPPQLPLLWETCRPSDLSGRFNIGVWYWELPTLPDEWRFAFDLVDEVWVGSDFVLKSVEADATVPVVKIPPCIRPTPAVSGTRSEFGLPDGVFLFLCAYDVLSTPDRKNPLGAVEAFERAFAPDDSSVALVMKINNAGEDPAAVKALVRRLRARANCFIIDSVLDRPHMSALVRQSDAYISLHRSEGFALVAAEAMSQGKPVVITNYGGSTDFASPDNACPVSYRLVPVRAGLPHYRRGQLWAEPDTAHASTLMRRLVADSEYYATISMNARRTMLREFSPEKVGGLMHDRLSTLGLL